MSNREARARLPLTDLPGDATVAAAVLERFVGQRLVTMDRDEADITHEALLGAWPRLRGWIDANREDIRVRRFITVAAQGWAAGGREPAALIVAVLVAAGLAGYAFRQRQMATAAKDEAESQTVAVEAGEARAEDPALSPRSCRWPPTKDPGHRGCPGQPARVLGGAIGCAHVRLRRRGAGRRAVR